MKLRLVKLGDGGPVGTVIEVSRIGFLKITKENWVCSAVKPLVGGEWINSSTGEMASVFHPMFLKLNEFAQKEANIRLAERNAELARSLMGI